ncbi:MAG: peptidoglycan-binding domain-containing protein [Bacteroidota bacterium]
MKRTTTAWMMVFGLGLGLMATPQAQAQQMTPPSLAGAEAGQCFAQVYTPPRFDTETRRVLKSEASERLEVSQPTFNTTTERYMSQEGGQRILVRATDGSRRPQMRRLDDGSIEIIPTGFTTTTERVIVKEASERLEVVPAEFETVTERVMVRPARTVWKPSTSRIYGAALRDTQGNMVTRIDQSGEVLCLVEEEAEFRTVTRRVVKSPARTRTVTIPAEYATITKRVPTGVMVEELMTDPQFDTYRKQIVQSEGAVRRVTIPAEFEEVTEQTLVSEGQMQWVGVLCEINVTRDKIREIQQALRTNGAYSGAIDGVYGTGTATAIAAYQRTNNLSTGVGLTLETLDRLGVSY